MHPALHTDGKDQISSVRALRSGSFNGGRIESVLDDQ